MLAMPNDQWVDRPILGRLSVVRFRIAVPRGRLARRSRIVRRGLRVRRSRSSRGGLLAGGFFLAGRFETVLVRGVLLERGDRSLRRLGDRETPVVVPDLAIEPPRGDGI